MTGRGGGRRPPRCLTAAGSRASRWRCPPAGRRGSRRPVPGPALTRTPRQRPPCWMRVARRSSSRTPTAGSSPPRLASIPRSVAWSTSARSSQPVGETLAGLSSGATNPVSVIAHADGSVSVNADDTAGFDARFLHDVAEPDLVSGAHDRLCAQSSVVFGSGRRRPQPRGNESRPPTWSAPRTAAPILTSSAPTRPGPPSSTSLRPHTSRCFPAPTSSPPASKRPPPARRANASRPIDDPQSAPPTSGRSSGPAAPMPVFRTNSLHRPPNPQRAVDRGASRSVGWCLRSSPQVRSATDTDEMPPAR